jgi:hypothetical protein
MRSRHEGRCIIGQIVAAEIRLLLSLDDRNGLALGNNVVDADQYRFDGACGGRDDRYFHLHGFDEHNLVAIADARAGFEGKRANASGNFGDDLDLWHPTLPEHPAD